MTKAYPSNLTWEQWELIAHLFPKAKTGGRPRKVCMYAVINAILYVLCQGCTWRALPGDFPAWSTVYGYFRAWRKDGTWLMVHDKLYQWVRVAIAPWSITRQQASDAVASCVQEAKQYVQDSPIVGADETSFNQGNIDGCNPKQRQAWLWVAVTPLVTFFEIALTRCTQAAKDLRR